MISLLSCNPIKSYNAGVSVLYEEKVLFLPKTFCDQHNHPRKDPNWQLLLQHKSKIKHCIVFAGKVDSGALDLIDLVCKEFSETKDRVYFVLCHHDLEQKIARIKSYGYTQKNWFTFPDRDGKCQEPLLLMGFVYLFIFSKVKK